MKYESGKESYVLIMMARYLELAAEIVLEPTLYIKMSKGRIPKTMFF